MSTHDTNSSEAERVAQREAIAAQLKVANIDTSSWGQGESKTLDELLKEVLEGEAELVQTPKGLVRRITVANIDVTYTDELGNRFFLIESRQVFKDGRERVRDLGTSVAEKIKPGEDMLASLKRALAEELQLPNTDQLTFIPQGTEIKTENSQSFPGLTTEKHIPRYTVALPPDLYQPAGYSEVQKDKTTFFTWQKIP